MHVNLQLTASRAVSWHPWGCQLSVPQACQNWRKNAGTTNDLRAAHAQVGVSLALVFVQLVRPVSPKLADKSGDGEVRQRPHTTFCLMRSAILLALSGRANSTHRGSSISHTENNDKDFRGGERAKKMLEK